MDGALTIGWRSAALGFAAVQILVLAGALAISNRTGSAGRLLAATLVVIAGMLAPYVLGFAGAYDVWRGLTFAPLAISLALGPLLWSYAVILADDRLPGRLPLHLAAPLGQFLYFASAFCLPTDLKWAWYTGEHRSVVSPLLDGAFLISLAAYTWAIGHVLRRHRARLADLRSDDDLHSARWLAQVRGVILVALALQAAYWGWDRIIGDVDFFDETPLYAALALLGLYLGIEGRRQFHFAADFRALEEAEPDRNEKTPLRDPDWPRLGSALLDRLKVEEWWREPGLSLPSVARRLGTNTGRASRIINLGLGVSFSTLVNGLRAEAVADAIAREPQADLLRLAFDYGFSSKASFNRAFSTRFGVAPSEYRRNVAKSDSLRVQA